MNKKLIALAIAGAFAAPFAMADDSNVVIYGEFAGSADYVSGGNYKSTVVTPVGQSPSGGLVAASGEYRGRVSSNNSFIGFKGTEDLGNGWAAVWQYEQSIAIDQQNIGDSSGGLTGGSNQTRRNTFVGLSSKQLGAMTLGVQDTPFKTSTGPLDVFGQHTLADYRSIWGTINGAPVASIRAQNSVMYTSPNMAGLTIKALAAAQNEAGNSVAVGFSGASSASTVNNPHYYSANVTYANGPIYAAVAYEDNRTVTALAVPTIQDLSYKNWRLGGGYSFAGFKVGLAYERIRAHGQSPAAAAPAVAQEVYRQAWYLPVSYQFGNNTIKAAYTKAGKTNQKSGAAYDMSFNDGAKQFSLGFDHAMSKRTNVYALYTQVRNDANGSYSLGGGGTGIAPVAAASYGEDPRAFSVGMVHKF